MSNCLMDPARRECAFRGISIKSLLLPHGVVVGMLAGVSLLNGCGGGSSSANGAASPTTPSANLSISATLPGGTVGSSYSGSIGASGGNAPYTFTVASGQLPQGVALGDGSGKVSGTPTASGSFSFSILVSDSKGDSKQQALQMSVANAPAPNPPAPPPSPTPSPTPPPPTTQTQSGNTFSNLQHSGGWAQYGQGPPNFVDCSPSPCDGISFWMNQGVQSPSMSGQATEYNVGGSTPYSDALWNNHLIGQFSSQGLQDTNQTIVPSLHDFTYDVYFYGDNVGLAQALEFDINQFFGGMGFIFGHECRVASGNQWDVWDNQNAHWVPTGVPCYPNSNSWNHLTLKVQRTSDNHLLYQSITLNGVTSNLNWAFWHGSANGWYGLTVNYQMDGNDRQDSYNMYLDKLNFTYQ
jgi:hypothetical protein